LFNLVNFSPVQNQSNSNQINVQNTNENINSQEYSEFKLRDEANNEEEGEEIDYEGGGDEMI
jgi:hypothetical protein